MNGASEQASERANGGANGPVLNASILQTFYPPRACKRAVGRWIQNSSFGFGAKAPEVKFEEVIMRLSFAMWMF